MRPSIKITRIGNMGTSTGSSSQPHEKRVLATYHMCVGKDSGGSLPDAGRSADVATITAAIAPGITERREIGGCTASLLAGHPLPHLSPVALDPPTPPQVFYYVDEAMVLGLPLPDAGPQISPRIRQLMPLETAVAACCLQAYAAAFGTSAARPSPCSQSMKLGGGVGWVGLLGAEEKGTKGLNYYCLLLK